MGRRSLCLRLCLWSAGVAAFRPFPPALARATADVNPAPSRLLDPARLALIDQALAAAVRAGQLPGAVVRVERLGSGRGADTAREAYERAVGLKALEPAPEPLDAATVYDCASLTKGVVTAAVFARLMQDGAVQPDTAVRALLPRFESDRGGAPITVGQLLTHTSGLPAGLPLQPAWSGQQSAQALAATRKPTHPPGTFFRYSDVNFLLLGQIAQRVTGQGLDALAHAWFFQPLGMRDSGFRPLADPQAWARVPLERIAPTEWDGEIGAASPPPGTPMLRGQVHDPTARRMGGVAGHAGLFSTAADLARFARMVLQGGELEGVRVLTPEAVARMTAVATPPGLPEQRSLGWDIDSPFSRARGKGYPRGSFGHTGFTGCSLWIDPFSRTFHVLLSNRVHPRTRESIVALYEDVGTRAADAVMGFDFERLRGPVPPR
jgi:CubicO group peptidase (beta-lactamase class C family)